MIFLCNKSPPSSLSSNNNWCLAINCIAVGFFLVFWFSNLVFGFRIKDDNKTDDDDDDYFDDSRLVCDKTDFECFNTENDSKFFIIRFFLI